MRTRKLGQGGLEVSEIGFGCMGMSWSYGPPKDKGEMTKLLHAAVDRGLTFSDTAEVYGPLVNEELAGRGAGTFSREGGECDEVWLGGESRGWRVFKMEAIHWGVLVMTLGSACIAHTQVVSRSLVKHDSSRDRLVGAWHLVRIEAPGAGGKSTGAPQPKGMLIYTRDGHMSVQLMYPPAAKAPDNEYVRNGYEASFGSYDVNEEEHTVTHHVQGSITREALVGKDLSRRYQFTKDGHLIIRSADANETWSVTWEHE